MNSLLDRYQNIMSFLFCKRFDTKTYSKEKSISTQMAARELRYNWFADLGFDKIATAHHQDDNIETLLLKKIGKPV